VASSRPPEPPIIRAWKKNTSIAPGPSAKASSNCETLFDWEAKKSRIAAIDAEQSKPEFWGNQERAQTLMEERKGLASVVAPLESAIKSSDDLAVMIEMADEDESLAAEVPGEVARLETIVEQLKLKALLNGQHDSAGAILSINARDGGTDANDWAEMLLRMYTQWAQKNGYSIELLERQDSEQAGISHAAIAVRGPMAYGYLRGETGMHRLVRISPFNAEGKRQTSFAAVDVSPEVSDAVEIEINPDDVREDTFRASGAGGQHVNKTSSAIRLTHVPVRHRRTVPERTLSAQEPGHRLEDAPRPHGPC
jgi:peptide chain release factor 2